MSEAAVGPEVSQFVKIQDLFSGTSRVQHARAGVVRHSPAPGDLPSGLAHRRQPGGGSGFPAGRIHAEAGASLTSAWPEEPEAVTGHLADRAGRFGFDVLGADPRALQGGTTAQTGTFGRRYRYAVKPTALTAYRSGVPAPGYAARWEGLRFSLAPFRSGASES